MMSTDELPPLPEPLCSTGVDHGYLTVEQTLAYGQQCHAAARAEAVELLREAREDWVEDREIDGKPNDLGQRIDAYIKGDTNG